MLEMVQKFDEKLNQKSRWILHSVEKITVPYQNIYIPGLICITVQDGISDLLQWGFTDMTYQQRDNAYDDLILHVGEVITSLIVEPPFYIRMQFESGSVWGVIKKTN